MNKSYDEEFASISGLSCNPWVGNLFKDSAYKLLIMGQSNYGYEGEIDNISKNKNFTREIIEYAINPVGNKGKWKTFLNLYKLLTGRSTVPEEDIQNIWDKVCFYDFVQKVMTKDDSGRTKQPEYEDYVDGIPVFKQLIKVLEPDACLFIGVSAAKAFCNDPDYGSKIIRGKQSVGGVYPRTGLIELDNKEISLYFMHHTSGANRSFKCEEWREHILEYYPNILSPFGKS
ncbi:hypothetical protein P0082_11240 [Candidatus Haliotispira prima]|uniref:Uracil-DNA glycosylase-like domain-containing protein n=1 Tax=Candidatus Haliotispira prima TaxID=3034016 RepID=A0ABY8MGQ2_9SPIO|nr:hypothetical protein P0082_11240 [Candidatus Haliotispira prima]